MSRRRLAIYGIATAALATIALISSRGGHVSTKVDSPSPLDIRAPTVVPSSIDPDDRAVIASLATATPADAREFDNGMDARPVDPISDRGTVAEKAAVELAVIDSMQSEITAFSVLPYGTADRLGCSSATTCPETTIDERVSAVRRHWTNGASPTKQVVLEGIAQALSASNTDPDRVGYSAGRFIVEGWKGVAITDGTATAVALARQEILMNPSDASSSSGAQPGGWETNYRNGLWQFWLVKEEGRWVLTDRQLPSSMS
jgi:hypothetical protein